MDKGMDRIAQDVKDIVETRTAIADKLEQLEHRFASTVEEAKLMAEDVADRTQSMIGQAVDSVKDVTDPSRLASDHPWVMVSGALLVGFAAGRLLAHDRNGVIPYYPPGTQAAPVMPSSTTGETSRQGVYPFYPENEDSVRTTPSPKGSVVGSLGTIVAESFGQLTTELLDIGRSALRKWLDEVVYGKRARSQSPGQSASSEPRGNRNSNHGKEHQRNSQLMDA
jgi:ElaB/YqjD/DUF883 family membrane-anchored ribosome-binding protein